MYRIPKANRYISTHTPLAGRDKRFVAMQRLPYISTHTPLAGRDTLQNMNKYRGALFLLTRPLRDVTNNICTLFKLCVISTHTPLAGRDIQQNPIDHQVLILISTHTPLAGRDDRWRLDDCKTQISTHTPLAGRDIFDS